jgi:hypothetical protein
MLEEESFDIDGHIRSCIIPTDAVKMISLELGAGENGILIDYEIKPQVFSQKESKRTLFYDTKIVPITMRKYLLYVQSRAG